MAQITGAAAGTRTPGAILPPLLRARLARLFDADLSTIEVGVSREVEAQGALAFACGNRVVLAPRVLALRPAARRAVLGHEIAHVLQQRQGATRRIGDGSPSLEAEAAYAARRIAAGRSVALRRRARHRPAASVQRIKLSLNGTKDGDLDAAALLNIMDSALATKLATAPACARQGGIFTVARGGHWLSLLGKLAMGTAIVPFGARRNSALPCTLKIGNTGSPMPIYEFGGTTERIDFPAGAVAWVGGRADKRDLNYLQIAEGFRRLNNAGHDDDDIAADLLLKMKGQATATDYGANANAFMEAMVALMFGVEASRFPSAFMSSLMLLDLVRTKKCYGRDGTKRFALATAFDSGKSFDFNCLYGGKFPCAVHEPGKGNASNRRVLGELGNQANDATVRNGNFARGEGVGMLLELNHRFIVPRREVTLLVHWLEARIGAAAIPYVRKATLQTVLETRIDQACGNDPAPPLPYAPRKDSGMHSADVPGQRTPVRQGTTVYYQTYDQPAKKVTDRRTGVVNFVAQAPKIGKYYHAQNQCKLLGGRTPDSRDTLLASYRPQDQASAPLKSTMVTCVVEARDLGTVRNFLCPHCAC